MRVAICLSGQIRTFDGCVDSILKYLIDYYNADVFCHTWTSNDSFGKVELTRDYIINKLMILKPKKILIEDFILEELVTNKKLLEKYYQKNEWHYKSPRTIGQYYSVYKSNCLKKQYEDENNFKYDIVFRFRYDLLLNTHILDKQLLESLDNTYLYMGDIHTSNDVDDRLYFGGSEIMDKVSSSYLYIDEYFTNDILIFCETLFSHHLKINNIIPLKLHISKNFKILAD